MSGLRSRLGALESAVTEVLGTAPALRLARAWRLRGAAILNYHCVREPSAWDHPHQVVGPDRFRGQLDVLAREADVVDLGELLDLAPSGARPRVAITFDDGYAHLLDDALPALAERGLPSAVFCCSDVLAGRRGLWWDELEAALRAAPTGSRVLELGEGERIDVALDGDASRVRAFVRLRERCAEAQDPLAAWAALREQLPAANLPAGLYLRPENLQAVERLGVEVGSHGASHARLSSLGSSKLMAELTSSRAALEQAVGHPVRAIAYPYGDRASVGAKVTAAAEAAGYSRGLVVRPALARRGDDPLALARVTVYSDDGARRFAAKAIGAQPGVYSWAWRRLAA